VVEALRQGAYGQDPPPQPQADEDLPGQDGASWLEWSMGVPAGALSALPQYQSRPVAGFGCTAGEA
jgi:hypothetical protein